MMGNTYMKASPHCTMIKLKHPAYPCHWQQRRQFCLSAAHSCLVGVLLASDRRMWQQQRPKEKGGESSTSLEVGTDNEWIPEALALPLSLQKFSSFSHEETRNKM